MTYSQTGVLRPLLHRRAARKATLAGSILPLIAAACLATPALAQTAAPAASGTAATTGTNGATLLDEVVVTATRTDETAAHVTSAYTKIDAEEIQRAQIPLVKQAVALSPGVAEWQTGAEGDLTSISIRGNRSQDTLLIIDGIKAKSNNFNYPYAFGSASALNLESVEVVRGPYSTLYGSNAIGGIVALQTKRGSGDPKATAFFEGGSYDTFREGIQSDGSLGALDYSFHYSREDTSNERPNNDFANNNGSLRLDWTANDKLTLGVSVRTVVSDYQAPGDIFTNDPNAKSKTELTTVASYAELKVTDIWTSKLTLGTYQERYHYNDPNNPGGPYYSYYDTLAEAANWTADWQNTLQLTETNRLLLGTTLLYETGHKEAASDYGYGLSQTSMRETATNVGVYAEDQWEIIKNLTLTAGLRYDNYELAGDAFTYRTGAAYFIEPTHTKLRTSLGTAFREPSFDEISSTKVYNGKSLDPERSRSWDIGFDQYLCNDRISVGAAYFNTKTKDALLSQGYYPNYYFINVDKQDTHGIENSATVKFNEHWRGTLAYTWTESETATRRYVRVPRHVVSGDTNYTFNMPKGKLTLGGGVLAVLQREDLAFDPVTYASSQVDMPDYLLLRVYGRYEVTKNLAFTARVENLTNKDYQTVYGYPALGRGIYGGFEVTF